MKKWLYINVHIFVHINNKYKMRKVFLRVTFYECLKERDAYVPKAFRHECIYAQRIKKHKLIRTRSLNDKLQSFMNNLKNI